MEIQEKVLRPYPRLNPRLFICRITYSDLYLFDSNDNLFIILLRLLVSNAEVLEFDQQMIMIFLLGEKTRNVRG